MKMRVLAQCLSSLAPSSVPTYRLERQWKLEDSEVTHMPVSKRAQKEQREANRKEEFKATGQYCEHGVYRCRICEHDKYHHSK